MKKILLLCLAFPLVDAQAEVLLTNENSDYAVKFAGHIKLDLIADLDGHRDKYQFLMSAIPVEGDADYNSGGYFSMHSKESRFSFDVSKEINGSDSKVYLEMDFFDEKNTAPRLRHFYFERGEFLVGQTWTNVSNLEAINIWIDFGAGDALYGNRKMQVRWQRDINESLQFAASIEEPSDTNIENTLGIDGTEKAKLPIFSSRLIYRHDRGHLFFAGEAQQLYWQGANTVDNDDAFGWSMTFSGSYRVFEQDQIKWIFAQGSGTSKGVIALAGAPTAASLDSNGKIQTDSFTNVTTSYTHVLNSQLNTSIGFTWLDVNPSEARDPNTNIKEAIIGHANLLYHYDEDIEMGIEYMWGTRININDNEGNNRRLQAMVKYKF
ncbi:DcaP family trimeric outer membrane transporter [Colwellia sp. RSH04]|uniref:DcaP family trimeric outer membrane transporter n=1 Tax=Colwellia sp. RSH04 TaxID=2305464 RepID=UPI000E5881B7|nr:DcaP family trimeric outer membrane transporter [Colwellia sp. RSH04]RHW75682.1 hypothetical protein D1094_11140 [Colwellia sp. RSH04]